MKCCYFSLSLSLSLSLSFSLSLSSTYFNRRHQRRYFMPVDTFLSFVLTPEKTRKTPTVTRVTNPRKYRDRLSFWRHEKNNNQKSKPKYVKY